MSSAREKFGLPADASPEIIISEWRKLASIHHPDKGGNPDEFGRFRKLYLTALEEARQPVICHCCKGKKKITLVRGFSQVEMICPTCKGTGVQI